MFRIPTRLICVLVVTASIVAGGSAAAQTGLPDSVSEEFRIGPEDVLAISVWGDEQISRSVPVRPDGKISLPLLSDVKAAGLTPSQLARTLMEALSKHLTDPRVSVIVEEVHSFKVSVIGEVKTPGRYEFKSQATVLDALAQAGGFTEYATKSRILILRAKAKCCSPTGKVRPTLDRIPFDYQRFVSAEGSDQDIDMQPGDIVVVR